MGRIHELLFTPIVNDNAFTKLIRASRTATLIIHELPINVNKTTMITVANSVSLRSCTIVCLDRPEVNYWTFLDEICTCIQIFTELCEDFIDKTDSTTMSIHLFANASNAGQHFVARSRLNIKSCRLVEKSIKPSQMPPFHKKKPGLECSSQVG